MITAPIDDLDPDTVGPVAVVTGAAGYLGRHLCARLVALGCEVRALDRVAAVEDLPGVVPVVGDVTDPAGVRAAVEGADVVLHTAARMSLVGWAPRRVRDEVWRVNVGGTQVVIDACRAAGVGRLVMTSSANVCIDRPIRDEDETAPYASRFVDLYGPSKVEAERRVLDADTPGALRTAALRPGGIWGGGAGGFMIQAFLDQLANGAFVATIGNGRAVVDNTHVETLVRAELLAATRLRTHPDVVGGQAYFITDDERINGIDWFRPIVEGLDMPWPRVKLPGWLMYGVAAAGEALHVLGAPEPPVTRIGILKLVRTSAFRTDKARRDLGWAPLCTSADGLVVHLDDYRALVAAKRSA